MVLRGWGNRSGGRGRRDGRRGRQRILEVSENRREGNARVVAG